MNRITKNLVFLAFIALFTAAAVEFGSVAILKLRSKPVRGTDLENVAVIPSAWRTHSLNPVYGIASDPAIQKYYHTANQQGFKYPRDISTEKDFKVVRIIAMGGSALYGWGSEGLERYGNHRHLANDETITFFLESEINEALARQSLPYSVEVINAGIPDYNSSLHLIYYNETIYEYAPHILLFLDGNNEFYGGRAFNPLKDYRNTGVSVIESFNGRYPWFALYVGARYLGRYLNFFQALQFALLKRWQSEEVPPHVPMYDLPESFDHFNEDYDHRARRTFLRTYTQLKAAADFASTTMLLFLQPQMLFEEPSLLSPEDERTWRYVSEDWRAPAGKVDRTELMRRVRSKIADYMRELGIEYYDVASIGSARTADRTLYIDYCHMTPDGARVLADRMFPPVYARVLKVVQSRQGAR